MYLCYSTLVNLQDLPPKTLMLESRRLKQIAHVYTYLLKFLPRTEAIHSASPLTVKNDEAVEWDRVLAAMSVGGEQFLDIVKPT